jgi:hypothetical protein
MISNKKNCEQKRTIDDNIRPTITAYNIKYLCNEKMPNLYNQKLRAPST